ncbi:long-chain-fatty-acid--CoA ligase [Actinomadura sp. 3N407]|uniref:long-chain-fatty-acid--CoA ligase n=1 Tax=Actinomadura sp. 3N407 TaxID=3457423 RepID=UPI003FCC940F
MLNLSVVLEHGAREHPDRTALVSGAARLSHSRLNALACQVAALLAARGIGPGDRVAVSCPNIAFFPIVYFGVLKAGATVVPLNVLLTSDEIAYHLADSSARAYFCFEGTAELPMAVRGRAAFDESPDCRLFVVLPADPQAELHPLGETLPTALAGLPEEHPTVATAPGDTAVVLYTSGTTGRPKGAELSHENMVLNAIVADDLVARTGRDAFLVSLPLFHSFGQTVLMNMGLRRGATLVLQSRFDAAEALAVMDAERVTLFAGVPTMYWALLGEVRPTTVPQHLRVAVSGGAALPVELLNRFEKVFGLSVQEGYGLSETSPVAAFNPPGRPIRPGSVGRPVWGVEMKLIDDVWNTVHGAGPGEIAVRGHNVMKGYLGRVHATAEVLRDGWFRTGDIARRDDDGYYFIVDRAKDLIIRGGFNVYPREIEDVLVSHPEVSLAAVVGVPHTARGEEIKAFVVREAGADVSAAELSAWCRERLAAYKYPRLFEFRDGLPLGPTGKILKRELR